MSWSREEVTVLIEEFRKWPNLYKIKSVNYKNRNLRKDALEAILNVIKTKKPNVTESEVQQKFQSLKQNALKERKKHVSSLKSGAGSEEIYEPSLWYYDIISYVFEHAVPRESFDSLSIDVECVNEANNTSDSQCFESPDFNFNEENLNILGTATISADREIVPEKTLTSTVELTGQMSPLSVAGPSKRAMSPISITGPGSSKRARKVDDKKFIETVTGNLKDLSAKLDANVNDTFGDYIVSKLNRIDVAEIRDEVEEKIICELNAALKKCRESHK